MTSLIRIVPIELTRHFRNPNRIVWILGFISLVQIYSVYALNIARSKLVYTELDADFYKVLFNFLLTVQIETLPVIILVITFDTNIQDPTMKLSAVAAINRHYLFVGKALSIVILSFIIFLVELLISDIFMIWIFGYDTVILSLSLKSALSFFIIIFYYVSMFTMIVLLIHKLTQDKLSTIVFPVLLFYVIPFLISSSLSFEILDINILNLSPIQWVSSFNNWIVFSSPFRFSAKIFIRTGLASLIALLLTIRYYEFQ